MGKQLRHDTGEWLEAIAASLVVGTAIGVTCGLIAGSGIHLSQDSREYARLVGLPVGIVGTVVAAVYFLRQFALFELDARQIWTAIGRLLANHGD